jgi:hypothetical protein
MTMRCTRWMVSGLAACALTLGGSGRARAELIDTTTSWDHQSAISKFGQLAPSKGGIATIGETFTTDSTHTTLNSLTFYVTDGARFGITLPPLSFQTYVMAWNGSQATGPVLYTSPVETASLAGLRPFTVNTSNLQLDPNQQYVAFISTSGLPKGPFTMGAVGVTGRTASSGGMLVSLANGNNFSAVTSQSWKTYPGASAAFRAHLSGSPSVSAAPVPGGLTMALLGCGSLLGWSWRRRRPA